MCGLAVVGGSNMQTGHWLAAWIFICPIGYSTAWDRL